MSASSRSKPVSTARAEDRSAPRVLVTGFGPFPGAPFNPTQALVRALARLPAAARGNAELATHVFRTRYASVDAELPALLAQVKPDALLMFGLAGRTPFLRIELRARNARSVLLPDAGGRSARGGTIVPHGPRALHGRAPFVPLLTAVRARGLPARLSRNAGRYLCNYAYWRGLESATPLVLFVHVPPAARNPRPRRAGRRRALRPDDLLRGAVALLRGMLQACRHR